MRFKFSLLILISLLSIHFTYAQNSSRKKSKKERAIERYETHRQALIDTNFVYQTKKIISPFVANNLSAGYLSISGNTLRIQELDWVDSLGKKIRLKELSKLKNYIVIDDIDGKNTMVTFSCVLRGLAYSFTISYNIKKESTLEIKKGREVVRYSGKVK